MKRDLTKRWPGEFAVIVLGVLAALAVDDYRQSRADRSYEAHVLQRLSSELEADLAELNRALSVAETRLWILNTVLSATGDSMAAAQLDSLTVPRDERVFSRPVASFLRSMSQYDLSDATYQELLSVGGMQTISDPGLREAISRY